MKGLTVRQQFVLDTITRLTRENKAAPSIRELAKAIGVKSTNGVSVHLKALRRKGVLAAPNGKMKSRGLRLKNQEACPCCGQSIRKDTP